MAVFEEDINVSANGEPIIRLRPASGKINVGRGGIPGSIIVANENNEGIIFMSARLGSIHLGREGMPGTITLGSQTVKETIRIAGESGDILLNNADCAEEFDVSDDLAEPGSVMVVDSDLTLRLCDRAYDKRVAGVVSGGGDYKPGIILDRQPSSRKRMPIAVIGKVYCKVDAQYGAIFAGDLLTTSPTLGHAMRAENPTLAFGTVIGKALRQLNSGTGLVPVLVSLQ